LTLPAANRKLPTANFIFLSQESPDILVFLLQTANRLLQTIFFQPGNEHLQTAGCKLYLLSQETLYILVFSTADCKLQTANFLHPGYIATFWFISWQDVLVSDKNSFVVFCQPIGNLP
jgi:hypothetical protein